MSTRQRVAVILFSGFLLSTLAVPAGASTTGDIAVTYTVSQTTDGSAAAVELTVSLPDGVTEFRVQPQSAVEVTATNGFSQEGVEYVWDGRTDRPTLTYAVPTSVASYVTESYAEFSRGYVEAGLRWRYRGSEPTLTRDVRLDGEGRVGGASVALWEGAFTARSADGTNVSVVVPPASGPGSVDVSKADLRDLRDDLVAVDEFFTFDRRDDHLVVLVRPTDSSGLEGSVVGSAGSTGLILLEPGVVTDAEVLAHEYTHTQQDFQTTRELDWFMEGSAEYYGQYYAYHTTDRRFSEFYDRLSVEDRYADTDLRSLTNASEPADYRKGGHVAAGLDTEIRQRSDGAARLSRVMIALRGADGGDPRFRDGGLVSESTFLSLAEDAAGSSVQDWFDSAVGGTPAELPRDRSLYAHDGTEISTVTSVPTATPSPTATPTPSTAPESTVAETNTRFPTTTPDAGDGTTVTASEGQSLSTALVVLTLLASLFLYARR